MAGYSGTPLPKKLGIKENFRVGLVRPPTGFRKELGSLPDKVEIITERLTKPLDVIMLFVDSEKVLKRELPKLAQKLVVNGMVWVAWPKKSSGVQTDLSFANVQQAGLQAGMVDVKICAVNDIWSGLKFVFRVKNRAIR